MPSVLPITEPEGNSRLHALEGHEAGEGQPRGSCVLGRLLGAAEEQRVGSAPAHLVPTVSWSHSCAGGGAATGTFLCLKNPTHYQKCPVTDGVGE